MRMPFRDISIRRKLALLTMGAVGFALVLACSAIALYQRGEYRSGLLREVEALADTLGTNTAAALVFDDSKSARDMLGALHKEQNILAACLYDGRGRIFAEYRRPDLPANFQMPAIQRDGAVFGSGTLVLFQGVYLNGERSGTIAFITSLAGFHRTLTRYFLFSLMVLMASAVATYLLCYGLVRIVASPILELSQTAIRISAREDYSIRAAAHGRDEIGTLVDAFNSMVERIQQREAALQQANTELEARVDQRTAELRREVVERQQAEDSMRVARDAAEVASRAKSEFLANMSHEIRTPLNGVLGMTELALDTELTAEQREYLETVKVSADSLLSVINDILDFSKIEARKIELEFHDFDIGVCVEDALRTFLPRGLEKSIALHTELAPDVPEMVNGDSSRLRQIILNLVGNALKFTEKGEVSLTVQRQPGETDVLRFVVSDTGIGIPPEKQRFIFDPFTQADSSTTRQYGGTGLGLTISARLVTLMGGRMWLESEVGHGSRFYFTVRLPEAAGESPRQLPSSIQILRGLKVLVVDDDPTSRRILVGMLSTYGAKITTAGNGEQALDELVAARKVGSPYRLLITDAYMDKMDGITLLERVRRSPHLSPLAVLMLASLENRGIAKQCRALGVARCLVKPIRRSELLSAVQEAFASPPPDAAAAGPCADGANAGRLHILLAEDNRVNQVVVVRMLEKAGHSVVVAGDGKQALELATSDKFDLLLMDVQMPELDGLAASRQIRRVEKDTGKHLPIIAMTAYAMKGDRERCLDAGMDEYVSKPVRMNELMEMISRFSPPSSPHEDLTWNRQIVLERLGGDEALLSEIVDLFLQESPRLLQRLREAIRQQNTAELARTAHALRGQLACLSITPAAETARLLEQMGLSGELEAAEASANLLGRQIDRATAVMISPPVAS